MGKEDIIKQNIINNVNKILESTLATFKTNNFNPSFGFNSSYAEIKIITMMYCAYNLMSRSQIQYEKCYELVLGIKKTLYNISQLEGLSPSIISDLETVYKKLVSYCNFNFATMFAKYPRLCITTNYDKVFPSMAIKPYDSQVRLIDEIKNKTSGLFCYKAMIGTGKTSFVIALCEYINILRNQQKAKGSNPSLQLIFTCSVQPVRNQVCRMAYNKQIPFGMAVMENDRVRIINNYSCKNDANRILIVADLDTTIELLNKSQDYILFVDEPTVGSDVPNHPITNAVAKVITMAPPITVLCSATLPDVNEISDVIQHFQNRHHNSEVISVCSKEALIGCEVINFDGSTIAPHNGCKSVNDLKLIIQNLKEKPFIDRLYTAPVVYRLRERMIDYGVKDIIDLEKYFSEADSLCQSNIQKAAIELLETLVLTDDNDLIYKVCTPLGKIDIQDDDIEETSSCDSNCDDEGDIIWETKEKKVINTDENLPYNLKLIFTKQAYRYAGGCLVTVNDPISFAKEMSEELLYNCDSASKIVGKYKSDRERLEMSISKLKNIKNETERLQKEQQVREDNAPKINFPSHLRVNTLRHLAKYAPQMKGRINTSILQSNYNLDSLPLDILVPDWVILLLFAGVGIYSPNNNLLSNDYTKLILNMASDRKLAFLISDENICYGANYPFSHVVIEDEFAEKHSIGTIFQLAGRAGRVGQSWVAYAHVGDKTSERIMKYIKGTENSGITKEAENLNIAFGKVIESLKRNQNKKKPNIENTGIKKIEIIRLSEVRPMERPAESKTIYKKRF